MAENHPLNGKYLTLSSQGLVGGGGIEMGKLDHYGCNEDFNLEMLSSFKEEDHQSHMAKTSVKLK